MHATLKKPRPIAGANTRTARMPCLINNDINANAFIEGFDPPIDTLLQARIALGKTLSTEERAALPSRINVSRRPSAKARYIYALNAGPFVLPEAAHDALTTLEPGAHEAPTIDCVDLDRTVFRDGRSRAYFDERMAADGGPGGGAPRVSIGAARAITLLADAIAGHHWWRAPREFSSAHFCSDALKERFTEAGVAGLQFTVCHTS